MKTTHLPTLFLFMLLLAAGVMAQASANRPPVSNPTVRASFAYCGSDDSCKAANRVRQDTSSEYVHGSNGVDAVFNLGSGTRDLTINLLTSQRMVQLDFSVMVNAGTGVNPSWLSSAPVQTVKAFMNVLGAYYAKETCPAAAAECDYEARFNLGQWKVAGEQMTYATLWNPLASTRPVNSPDITSYVNVRYIRDDGNGEVFIITPKPNPGGYALSGLEQTNKKAVKGAGQFHLPFTLTVRPQ